MTLDDDNQRAMLLEIIDASHYPGSAVDKVFYLKQAIRYAALPRPVTVPAPAVDDAGIVEPVADGPEAA